MRRLSMPACNVPMADFITKTDDGYTSTNAYMAKSDGKYAKSAANPLNYSFIFVLAMAVGAAASAWTVLGCLINQKAPAPTSNAATNTTLAIFHPAFISC